MSQPATVPTMADNFFLEAMKPAFREDPYPFYDRFRGSAPLLRVADTIWFALGHAEVAAMLRHPRLSTDEVQHAATKAGQEPDPNRVRSLLFMDPPDHTRLRGLVARAFTPRRIEDLRTATEEITAGLIEAMARQRGTVDLIEAFAYPLPVRVICTLLGVPARDEAIFTNWSRGIARSVDPSVLRPRRSKPRSPRRARASGPISASFYPSGAAGRVTIFYRPWPPSTSTATASRRARSSPSPNFCWWRATRQR